MAKGKAPLSALTAFARVAMARSMATKRSRIITACTCLSLILLLVYTTHRSLSFRANKKGLFRSIINDISRECDKPTYEILDPTQLDPHKICITTLTDAAYAGRIQKMLRWRNFDNLLEMTWPNKMNYAKKHGYQLFNESRSLDRKRPPSWSKIRAAQRLLTEEDCEWVVWWDADTVIMNSEKRIQDFLPADKDLLLTQQKQGSYNAGAWVIKKSDWSLKFLDHWWNMKSFVKPKGLSTSGDNDALKHYLLKTMPKEEFEQHIGVPPRCTFNSDTVFLTRKQFIDEKNGHLEEFEYYLDESKYHKGDLIAHIAGKDNKIDTTAIMLEDAELKHD